MPTVTINRTIVTIVDQYDLAINGIGVTINGTVISSVDIPGVVGATKLIAPNLTSIGDYAFDNSLGRFTALKTVDCPNLTTIGISAFEECKALTTVDFPNLTAIGNYAFLGTALTTIDCTNLITIGVMRLHI